VRPCTREVVRQCRRYRGGHDTGQEPMSLEMRQGGLRRVSSHGDQETTLDRLANIAFTHLFDGMELCLSVAFFLVEASDSSCR